MKNVEPGFVGTELGDGTLDPGNREQLEEWRQSMEILRSEDIAELIVVPTPQG